MTDWDATTTFPAAAHDEAEHVTQQIAVSQQNAAAPPPDTEYLTCPECGTGATVTLNRRLSEDFCRKCDYPLFWTPSAVVLDRGGLGDDSLRRLPGTTGRALIASVPCPHCSELNPVTAESCVRCGRPLHVKAEAAPPPKPVYMPEPEPWYEPPPEPGTPLWVWVAAFVITIGVALSIILGATLG